MPKTDRAKLKDKIKRRAKAMDINMLGVAPVERWSQEPRGGLAPEYLALEPQCHRHGHAALSFHD